MKRLKANRTEQGWVYQITFTGIVETMGEIVSIADYEGMTVNNEKSGKGLIIAEEVKTNGENHGQGIRRED